MCTSVKYLSRVNNYLLTEKNLKNFLSELSKMKNYPHLLVSSRHYNPSAKLTSESYRSIYVVIYDPSLKSVSVEGFHHQILTFFKK